MDRALVVLAGFASLAPRVAAQRSGSAEAADRYVSTELARQRIPGFAVAILRGDQVILARGYGFANLEHRVRATDSTVFEVGSVTKQFTAAAVVMLSEQGRLRLSDPITQYLPEGSSVWSGVTIQDVLTHTSGIPEYDADSTFDWHRDYTEDEFVRLAAKRPLDFVPGESESYSSTGYFLLGVIVHRVSGVTWGEFLQRHVFRPLNMRTAHVNSEADIIPNRAAGYEFTNDTLRNQEWVPPTISSTADLGLSLSARDLAGWAVGLDHEKVLSHAGLEASWSPVRLKSGESYPYGFGWHVTQQRGYRRIGHGGSWQGFQASIQRYPDFHLTVIVLANLAQANTEAIAFGIAGLMEPVLSAPHLWTGPRTGITPPRTIDRLLSDIASSADSLEVTPGLRRVTPTTRRERIGRWVNAITQWTSLGCDTVANRRIIRLGAEIQQICYAKGATPQGNILFSILYDAH